MNKKIFLTSILAIGFAMPAMADNITNQSSCTTGVLGQSDNNSTANVEAEWTPIQYSEPNGQYLRFENGTITQHVTCPAGYYCEGFEDEDFRDESMNITSCSEDTDGSFPYSAAGSFNSGQCYATGSDLDCSALNPYTGSHGTANYANSTGGYASYKSYNDYGGIDDDGYGAVLDNTNACSITSLTCDTGYRQVDGGPLRDYVYQWVLWAGNTGIKYRAINGDSGSNSGNNNQGDHTGMTNGTWEVAWPDTTKVAGTAMCSSTNGGSWGTTGTPDTTGAGDTKYCWCKMDSYTLNGAQSAVNVGASSSWVFNDDYGSASNCAFNCALNCADDVQFYRDFRGALFGSLGANPVCTANTINIQWYNQNTVHESNSCTYGDTITLPSTNPTRTGYTFGGWQLRTTNNN